MKRIIITISILIILSLIVSQYVRKSFMKVSLYYVAHTDQLFLSIRNASLIPKYFIFHESDILRVNVLCYDSISEIHTPISDIPFDFDNYPSLFNIFLYLEIPLEEISISNNGIFTCLNCSLQDSINRMIAEVDKESVGSIKRQTREDIVCIDPFEEMNIGIVLPEELIEYLKSNCSNLSDKLVFYFTYDSKELSNTWEFNTPSNIGKYRCFSDILKSKFLTLNPD